MDNKGNGEAKGSAQTDDSYFNGERRRTVASGDKKAQCREKKDQGGTPPTATVQAVESVSQIQIWRGRFILGGWYESLEWTERESLC